MITVRDRVNLKSVMSALFKMDAVLSMTVSGDMTVSAEEVDTVRAAMSSLSGDMDESVVKKVALSPFVLDMFYCYSINKTAVTMDLWLLDRFVDNRSFLDIFLFPIWKQKGNEMKENVNVYRPVIYELFPNLRQITIRTTNNEGDSVYPIEPQTLLNVVQNEKRPPKLRTIQIADYSKTKWSEKVFDEKVIAKYKAMNIGVELKDYVTSDGEPWVKVILSVPPPSEQ